jgi:hypothetical protein
MPIVILIDQNGNPKEHNLKTNFFEFDTLYKKIGFKNNNNFELITQRDNIFLYGKTKGRKGQENKYIFEESFLKKDIIIFGSCILLIIENNIIQNLYLTKWNEEIINCRKIRDIEPVIIIPLVADPQPVKIEKAEKHEKTEKIKLKHEDKLELTNELLYLNCKNELEEEDYIEN